MAFSQSFKFRCKGAPELVKRLQQIDKKVAKKALRRAVELATKPVIVAARQLVPVDTALLKKSLGRVIKSYKGGLVIVGIVGPRRGGKGRKGGMWKQVVRRRGRNKDTMANPSKYAHLVEFGTRTSRAKPFLRPAFEREKGKCAAIMLSTLRAALAKASRGA